MSSLTEQYAALTPEQQKLDWQLPQEAIAAVRQGSDEKNVDGRYLEPITALQDDDLEFSEDMEFAYYAIYNLFRFHVMHKLDDSWLIVNQALTALGADTAVSHLTSAINQLLQPPLYARSRCLICGLQALLSLLNLSESGVPHGAAGHVLTYDYSAVAVCSQCGCGQLEKYSHDCFHYYGDEDWDMYWWFVLTPADVLRLHTFLGRCPNRLDVQCDCAIHTALRVSSAQLWGAAQDYPGGTNGVRLVNAGRRRKFANPARGYSEAARGIVLNWETAVLFSQNKNQTLKKDNNLE